MSRFRGILGSAAALAALSLTCSAAQAAEVLDAHAGVAGPGVVGQIFGPGMFNAAVAQTFTAEHSGAVSRLTLNAGWFRGPPPVLQANLVLLDGLGLPAATLASASLINPVSGTGEFLTTPVTFDFTGSGANLTAGAQYAVVLNASACCGGVSVAPGDGYLGGRGLVQSDAGLWSDLIGSDLVFQLYVNEAASLPPPPPPSRRPVSKDDCKGNGWKTFTNPSFRNQGLCVAYTNHN